MKKLTESTMPTQTEEKLTLLGEEVGEEDLQEEKNNPLNVLLAVLDFFGRYQGVIFAVFAVIGHSSRLVATKSITNIINPTEIHFANRVIVTILCIPFVMVNPMERLAIGMRGFCFILIIGLISTVAGVLADFAIKFATAGDVSAVFTTTPIFVSLIDFFVLGEHMTWLESIFYVTSFIGILITSEPKFLFEGERDDFNFLYSIGIALAIISTFTAATQMVLKRYLMFKDYDAHSTLFYISLISTFLSIVPCFIFKGWSAPPVDWSLIMLVVSSICVYTANVFGLFALMTMPAYQLSFILVNTVVLTYILEIIILGRPVVLIRVIGAFISFVSTSVVIIIRSTYYEMEDTSENTEDEEE